MHSAIKKTRLTIAILGAAALSTSTSSFARVCGANGICVDTKPRGDTLLVRYSGQAPATHVNVIPVTPPGGQFELNSSGGEFRLPIGFESRVRFKMQKCVRGGIAQRSTCGPWVTFSRKVD